ncbi:DsrE family protein [Rhodopirellula sp. MGV]|uniref:DsrE family protein n=1 Tax=Rhodopirellula sp. MGV TaxID=2023130 RepID=UPI000B96E732|nr:DsrE family protein [Rhodopirellula sp. MGV]OYP36595.1 hypothetical protein CGZ80_08175 [Rhodopirellula sp. MGV]PNY34571.1 hypothetical protein C2E31_22990 [Rhodopirellula baltica]
MNGLRSFTLIVIIATAFPAISFAQQGPGRGFRGGGQPGAGRGMGRGLGGPGFGGRGAGGGAAQAESHGHDERHDADRDVFQFLLQNHTKINRTVTELPNGVETLTESADPDVADKIKEHVSWMEYRIENTNPIRMRDPLFAELFKHTDKIEMKHVDTENGVRVTETSSDPAVAKLIQAHAKVVTGFVERGFAEAMKNHPVPGSTPTTAATSTPTIAGYGKVVQLADAVQQPRDGTKIVVDLTRGGDAKEINPGLEKIAKYLNIYAGGGAEPASVHIAVVLHGDATFTVLNSDAYARHFNTQSNPNLTLLHELHEAEVEIYVCGQTLISKGSRPDEVAVFVDTAVSAVTSIANLQADGYAYLPLGN